MLISISAELNTLPLVANRDHIEISFFVIFASSSDFRASTASS